MMNNIAIKVDDVSMKFNLASEKVNSFKEFFIKRIKGQIKYEEFWALKNVSLEIKKGESWAFVGTNGSGKSTLLKVISGIYKPTKGSVTVNGKVAPLINLGAGFDSELTARENVYLNGTILGYKMEFIEQKFDEIIAFAELEKFVDVPIKKFSSGMTARLGFSIATAVEPDILIVDEVLSVGDYLFREKCEKRISEILSKGATLILVSHSADQVKKLCNKAVLINKGDVVMIGDATTVCNVYEKKDK